VSGSCVRSVPKILQDNRVGTGSAQTEPPEPERFDGRPQQTSSMTRRLASGHSSAITTGRSSKGIGSDNKTSRGIRAVSSDIKERYENQVAVIKCRTRKTDYVDQWEDNYRSQKTLNPALKQIEKALRGKLYFGVWKLCSTVFVTVVLSSITTC
jgi:hypothetical protein